MTILVYSPENATDYVNALRAALPDIEWLDGSDPAQFEAGCRRAEAIFCWRFPTEQLPRFQALRWIQQLGAGVDDWIGEDVPSTVTLTRVDQGFGAWMAEYVLAYLLRISWRLDRYQAQQRERVWRPLAPSRLRGKRVGIAGLGAIGRTIVEYLVPFGVDVVGLSRTGRPVPGCSIVYSFEERGRFFEALDFCVLTLPATDATRKLVDRDALRRLPSHAWLINIGRGALIDEAAILDSLRRNAIGGAVLDVFAEEPLPADHPFWTFPNVWITPHISGPGTLEDLIPFCIEQVRAWRAGRPLRGVVDRQRGY